MIALFIILGNLTDYVTYLVLPDGHEMNPIAAYGPVVALAWKMIGVAWVIGAIRYLNRRGHSQLALIVGAFAIFAAGVGTGSNMSVLLGSVH